ncbi:MAG TPA: sialidase family protein [Candidatus Thermoplasmatota archaeon]|nr:sialidase family protein [Candidatus Thermoplasmatota archaeon]
MRVIAVVPCVAVLLAGCLLGEAPGAATQPPPPPPTMGEFVTLPTGLACRSAPCEPTVAVDGAGRLIVLGNDGLGVSLDEGRSFEKRPRPPIPPPAPPGSFDNDATLYVDASGKLYYHALVTTFEPNARALILHGIHVAVSADAGVTWPVNTHLSLASATPRQTLGSDRQWLAADGNATVYLWYARVSPAFAVASPVGTPSPVGGVMLARSDDGGRTFGDFRPVAPDQPDAACANGPGVVDPAGRLHIAFRCSPRAASLDRTTGFVVATSSDRGQTFTRSLVNATANWLPVLDRARDGAVHAAWVSVPNGQVATSTSRDGGATWSAPVGWTEANERGAPGPWVLARADGRLDVLLYLETAPRQYQVVLARGFPDGSDATRAVLVPKLDVTSGRAGNTDFAHFAHLPDGRVVAVWGEAREVLIAVEQRIVASV